MRACVWLLAAVYLYVLLFLKVALEISFECLLLDCLSVFINESHSKIKIPLL